MIALCPTYHSSLSACECRMTLQSRPSSADFLCLATSAGLPSKFLSNEIFASTVEPPEMRYLA